MTAAECLLATFQDQKFRTVLADPPWRFQNRTGKVAPEHRRLMRYQTMAVDEIKALPIPELIEEPGNLYLWAPNGLIREALAVMEAWGFEYKSMIVWHKVRKDGGSDGRGGWVLFQERHRDRAVRRAGQERANPRARTSPSEPDRHKEAGPQREARRAIPDHRELQPRTVPGVVRAAASAWLDFLG
jgi:N6-adenosine-specific RNA methylase IME4